MGLAKGAKAVYRIRRIVLVNTDLIEHYRTVSCELQGALTQPAVVNHVAG